MKNTILPELRRPSTLVLNKILAVLCILLLFIYITPLISRAHATGITVSNVTFDPATGAIAFDYSGDTLNGSQNIYIYDTTGTTLYWDTAKAGHCTSSHCVGSLVVSSNSDSGVSLVIIEVGADQSQSLTYPLPTPTNNTPQTSTNQETLYTLTLSSTVNTTSNSTASFGSITLPVKSNICVHAEWILQNNSSGAGVSAALDVDSTKEDLDGWNNYRIGVSGIRTDAAYNYCLSNVSAGSHTFGVDLGQYDTNTGENVYIFSGSKMFITAYPTP